MNDIYTEDVAQTMHLVIILKLPFKAILEYGLKDVLDFELGALRKDLEREAKKHFPQEVIDREPDR